MITKPANSRGIVEEIPEVKDLREVLRSTVKRFGTKDAFYIKKNDAYHGISYLQFEEHVNALGTVLLSLGYKNEKIAIISENRYEWCLSYMTVVSGVGTVVPLDKELPEREVQNLLIRSGASVIIYSDKLAATVENSAKFCPNLKLLISMDASESTDDVQSLYQLINRGKDLLAQGKTAYLDAVIDPDALGVLVFTSGTTDLAKGVMLSHSNIIFDMIHVLEVLYIDEYDRVLSILPLHHTYECTCGFLIMFFMGARLSFSESIKSISKNLREVKPTVLIMVPLILENMYKRIFKTAEKSPAKKYLLKTAMPVNRFLNKTVKIDLSKKLFKEIHENIGGSVRLVISGAAAINHEIVKGFEAIGITIRQGYGMTECAPIITVNSLDKYRHDSIGIALPGIRVEIDNPDAAGVGEIKVHGKNVMLGYYENKEATDKVLKDGWLYTGDIGYRDNNGFFYITGRKKNVIVTKNGKNIFPEEVEAYLDKCPLILESIVRGKEQEDGETIVVAEIVISKETILEKFETDSLPENEIRELIQKEIKNINRQMPLYKRIMDFTLRDTEFEKTTTHKIKRH